MRLSEAKELLRELLQEYFEGAEVTLTKQSRVAKPDLPLVAVTTGSVHRPTFPIYPGDGTYFEGSYLSRVQVDIDLFTHGSAVTDEDTGETVAYENTAMDDMLSLMDFLDSQYTIDWCHEHDLAILFDGDPQDLTGLVNDSTYEYRARLSLNLYYTQGTVGYAAVLPEDSIRSSDTEAEADADADTESGSGSDGESGRETESGSDASGTEEESEGPDASAFEQTSSGGGSRELAEQETGYFTDAEIEEDYTS